MEYWELQQMQELPLEAKILKTQMRIREWYEYWGGDICISFIDSKDSIIGYGNKDISRYRSCILRCRVRNTMK